MTLFRYHRLYLNEREFQYLHHLMFTNVNELVPRPEAKQKEIHVSILNKLIRKQTRIEEGKK